ncbi:MAG: hypothetical protein OSB19_02085 [Opitutaceae bacterium]|nr:hypothetical protein [Opitutaceae bacterium]
MIIKKEFVKVAGGNVGVAKATLGSLAARWASSLRSSFAIEGCLNLFGFQPTYIRNANPDKISQLVYDELLEK